MSNKVKIYEGWVTVFSSGTDYEADLVRDRLDDSGLKAVVLTQRDHAFNLNVGDLTGVHVLVPPEEVEEARTILAEEISDEELERAAMEADPDSAPAHTDREEASLDSGPESIKLDVPPEDEDDHA